MLKLLYRNYGTIFFTFFFITGIHKFSRNTVNQTGNDHVSTEETSFVYDELQNTDPKEGTYTLAKMILSCPYKCPIFENASD